MRKINEYTGGIFAFIVALISLFASLVSGATWLVVVAFVVIVIIAIVFAVLLWQRGLLIQDYKRFVTGRGFKSIRLNVNQTFTLDQLGPIAGAPYGQVQLGGVPFQILAENNGLQFLKVQPPPNNAPRTAEILINIGSVRTVFLLMNVNYGLKSWYNTQEGWEEKIVGRLRFEFRDNPPLEQPLQLGYHIRDIHPLNQPYAVEKLRSEQANNVWLGPNQDTALDLLKVELPKPLFLQRIVVSAQLETDNFSQVPLGNELVGPPSIHIYGITCWLDKNADIS